MWKMRVTALWWVGTSLWVISCIAPIVTLHKTNMEWMEVKTINLPCYTVTFCLAYTTFYNLIRYMYLKFILSCFCSYWWILYFTFLMQSLCPALYVGNKSIRPPQLPVGVVCVFLIVLAITSMCLYACLCFCPFVAEFTAPAPVLHRVLSSDPVPPALFSKPVLRGGSATSNPQHDSR